MPSRHYPSKLETNEEIRMVQMAVGHSGKLCLSGTTELLEQHPVNDTVPILHASTQWQPARMVGLCDSENTLAVFHWIKPWDCEQDLVRKWCREAKARERYLSGKLVISYGLY